MRWGRSRRRSLADLPALRAGNGGFFHQRTAVKFLSGSTMPDFHASPGAANGGRSVTAQPYDGRLLGDWLHRLRPPLETISLAGMGIAGGADMAHFSTLPARRALRCMPPAACCATAGSGCAPDEGCIWSMAMRWSPVCCDPPSTPGCVFSSTPRRSDCCRVRRECPVQCCAATAGRYSSKRAPWCWPAAVFPTIGSAWRRWCLMPRRVTAISPPRRLTIRARDPPWRIRRRPVRYPPAPPAGTGAGVPRHPRQRPAADVSPSGGTRQARGDRRPA